MTTVAAHTDIASIIVSPTIATPSATASPAAAKPPAPIRWRQALLTGLAVYPFITLYIWVLFPFTDGWAMWQRTMLLVPIMVLTMVYGIAPALQKHLGWFISGRPAPGARK